MSRSRSVRFSPWPILLPLAAIAMAVAVFSVTQSVQRREARVNELNRQLLSEQQTLRVLDAEWAYLTRPQRLEELMTMKQDMVMPPAPTPVANIVEEIPAEAVAVSTAAAVEPVAEAETAIGQMAAAPVIVKDTPQTVEIAHPSETVKKAKPAAKAAAPKTAAKKASVKTASAAPGKKKQPVKSMDGAWPIARKGAPAPQRQAIVAAMPMRAMPVRAGVARPIVE